MNGTNSPPIEIPRGERSGFRRAAQTSRKCLKFPVLSSQEGPNGTICRWLKFNCVGGIGIVVQLAALAIFRCLFGFDYLLATGLAVEVAVLHNFLWHERFTWADRPTGRFAQSLIRLARFNLSNGAVSILGNLALMRLLVGTLRLNYLGASLIAVAACSALNFLLSDHFVFSRRTQACDPG